MRLDELEAIARAATPDRWGVLHMSVGADVRAYPDTGGSTWIAHCRTECDAAHIAAFSPARVLPMLDALKKGRLAMKGANKEHWDAFRTALAAFDEMEGK